MRENELAELLIRMAADRGVDVESAAEELASIGLPSFVDARAFQAAVIQALEQHLRAQVEVRLQSIRRRFDMDPQKRPAPAPRPAVTSPPIPAAVDVQPTPARVDAMPAPADATMTDLAPMAPAADNAAAGEEELPTDATMVWTTRHG